MKKDPLGILSKAHYSSLKYKTLPDGTPPAANGNPQSAQNEKEEKKEEKDNNSETKDTAPTAKDVEIKSKLLKDDCAGHYRQSKDHQIHDHPVWIKVKPAEDRFGWY